MKKLIYSYGVGLILFPALVLAESGAHASSHEVNYLREVLFPYINFFTLFVILFFAAKKPLQEFFLTRSKEMAAHLDQAAHEKQEALTRYQQSENRLLSVENEMSELKKSFQTEGELTQKKIIQEAKNNADALKDMAQRLSQQELLRSKAALKEETASLVVSGATQLVKDQLNPQDQSRLFETNLARLEVFK